MNLRVSERCVFFVIKVNIHVRETLSLLLEFLSITNDDRILDTPTNGPGFGTA